MSTWSRHRCRSTSKLLHPQSKNHQKLPIYRTTQWLLFHVLYNQTAKINSNSLQNPTRLSNTTLSSPKSKSSTAKVKLSGNKLFQRHPWTGTVTLRRIHSMQWFSCRWSRIRSRWQGTRIRIDPTPNRTSENQTAPTSPVVKYLKLPSCKCLRPQFSRIRKRNKFSPCFKLKTHPKLWRRATRQSYCLTHTKWVTLLAPTPSTRNWHSSKCNPKFCKQIAGNSNNLSTSLTTKR